jgi:hypothetical protein
VLSRYAATKIKHQNRFNAKHKIRIYLSKTVLDFNGLVASKQPPFALHKYKYNINYFLKYGVD